MTLDVTNCTRLNSVFKNATSFNSDISNWILKFKITSTFENASNFNKYKWLNVGKVTTAVNTLFGLNFNHKLEVDVRSISNMNNMFDLHLHLILIYHVGVLSTIQAEQILVSQPR